MAKNRTPKKANWDQNSTPKFSRIPVFEWPPRRCRNSLSGRSETNSINLPKEGTENNSPANTKKIYMLWSYYLVQVWPFWKLLSGPSLFFFQNTDCQKKHYKNRGFSPLFLEKKLRAKILEVIIWSKLAFFKTQSTWTR